MAPSRHRQRQSALQAAALAIITLACTATAIRVPPMNPPIILRGPSQAAAAQLPADGSPTTTTSTSSSLQSFGAAVAAAATSSGGLDQPQLLLPSNDAAGDAAPSSAADFASEAAWLQALQQTYDEDVNDDYAAVLGAAAAAAGARLAAATGEASAGVLPADDAPQPSLVLDQAGIEDWQEWLADVESDVYESYVDSSYDFGAFTPAETASAGTGGSPQAGDDAFDSLWLPYGAPRDSSLAADSWGPGDSSFELQAEAAAYDDADDAWMDLAYATSSSDASLADLFADAGEHDDGLAFVSLLPASAAALDAAQMVLGIAEHVGGGLGAVGRQDQQLADLIAATPLDGAAAASSVGDASSSAVQHVQGVVAAAGDRGASAAVGDSAGASSTTRRLLQDGALAGILDRFQASTNTLLQSLNLLPTPPAATPEPPTASPAPPTPSPAPAAASLAPGASPAGPLPVSPPVVPAAPATPASPPVPPVTPSPGASHAPTAAQASAATASNASQPATHLQPGSLESWEQLPQSVMDEAAVTGKPGAVAAPVATTATASNASAAAAAPVHPLLVPAETVTVRLSLQGVSAVQFRSSLQSTVTAIAAQLSGTSSDHWQAAAQDASPGIPLTSSSNTIFVVPPAAPVAAGRRLAQQQQGGAAQVTQVTLSLLTSQLALVVWRLEQAPLGAAAVPGLAGCSTELCVRLTAAGVPVVQDSIAISPSYNFSALSTAYDEQLAANHRLAGIIAGSVAGGLLLLVLLALRKRLCGCCSQRGAAAAAGKQARAQPAWQPQQRPASFSSKHQSTPEAAGDVPAAGAARDSNDSFIRRPSPAAQGASPAGSSATSPASSKIAVGRGLPASPAAAGGELLTPWVALDLPPPPPAAAGCRPGQQRHQQERDQGQLRGEDLALFYVDSDSFKRWANAINAEELLAAAEAEVVAASSQPVSPDAAAVDLAAALPSSPISSPLTAQTSHHYEPAGSSSCPTAAAGMQPAPRLPRPATTWPDLDPVQLESALSRFYLTQKHLHQQARDGALAAAAAASSNGAPSLSNSMQQRKARQGVSPPATAADTVATTSNLVSVPWSPPPLVPADGSHAASSRHDRPAEPLLAEAACGPFGASAAAPAAAGYVRATAAAIERGASRALPTSQQLQDLQPAAAFGQQVRPSSAVTLPSSRSRSSNSRSNSSSKSRRSSIRGDQHRRPRPGAAWPLVPVIDDEHGGGGRHNSTPRHSANGADAAWTAALSAGKPPGLAAAGQYARPVVEDAQPPGSCHARSRSWQQYSTQWAAFAEQLQAVQNGRDSWDSDGGENQQGAAGGRVL